MAGPTEDQLAAMVGQIIAAGAGVCAECDGPIATMDVKAAICFTHMELTLFHPECVDPEIEQAIKYTQRATHWRWN